MDSFTAILTEHLELLKSAVLAEHERLLHIAGEHSQSLKAQGISEEPFREGDEQSQEQICQSAPNGNEHSCESLSEQHVEPKFGSELPPCERQISSSMSEKEVKPSDSNEDNENERQDSKSFTLDILASSVRQNEGGRGPAVTSQQSSASASTTLPLYTSTSSELMVPKVSRTGSHQIPEEQEEQEDGEKLTQVPSITLNGVGIDPTHHHLQLNPSASFRSVRASDMSCVSEDNMSLFSSNIGQSTLPVPERGGCFTESLVLQHSRKVANRQSRAPMVRGNGVSVLSRDSVRSRDSGWGSRSAGFHGGMKGERHPRDEKEDFKVLPGWERAVQSAHTFKNCFNSCFTNTGTTESYFLSMASKNKTATGMRRFVLAPNSPKRVLWDLMCMVFTSFDAIVVPLQFLELDTDGAFLVCIAWLTRLFWTVDLSVSAMTGYTTNEGEVEMRPKRTWKKYARTWFPFDATLVFADWLQEALTGVVSSAGSMSHTRFARIARLIRLVRVTRLIRLARIVTSMLENVNLSEHLSVFSNISLDIVAIFYLVHLVACMWYAVGRISDRGWSNVSGIHHEPLMKRYITSMYWSAAVVTGSPAHSSPMGPASEFEDWFCVLAIFCSFVLAACFLSSFTSSLTKYHMISSTTTSQLAMLRMYMKQRGISPRLSQRVLRNATHLLFEQSRKTPEENVKLLGLLSRGLRLELHFEERSGALLMHPLFAKFCQHDISGMKLICHSATCIIHYCIGDILFETGEQPPAAMMLFLLCGTCQYIDGATGDDVESLRNFEEAGGEPVYCSEGDACDTSNAPSLHIIDVVAGEWVGEPAMWTSWVYRGLLRGSRDGQMISLEGDVLAKICQRLGTFNMRDYAIAYVEYLNILKGHCSELAGAIDEKEIVQSSFGSNSGQNGNVIRSSKVAPTLAEMVGFRVSASCNASVNFHPIR